MPEARALRVGDHRLDHRGARQAVRAGAQRRRVRLDDAPGALAVDDLHRHRPRLRAAELGVHRDAVALAHRECHLDEKPVLGGRALERRSAQHPQGGERVRVEPGAVPGVEAVGDDVLGLAAADHRGDGGQRDVGGRARAEHRGVRRRLPLLAEPHPDERAVVVGVERAPAGPALRPQRHAVPAAHQGVADHRGVAQRRAQVRAGAGSGVQRAVGGAPGHHLAPGDGPAERPARPHLPAAGEHVPAPGRPGLRAVERRADQPGLAVGPRGLLVGPGRTAEPAQRVRRAVRFAAGRSSCGTGISESGPFGWGSLTRAGYARGPATFPAIRPAHSHWLRRNTRNSSRQATNVSTSIVGKPSCQCSPGISSKFMP